ncbi:MAG: two-component sensor histidine kinase [Proteobacteria bacterium]|nr:two-component sensor histidine kinase [Pseudomonadota bacterium]
MLNRASFRQLLAVAFLLVPALLAVVSVRGLYTLERLMVESRQGAEHAARDAVNVQRVAERSVTMERSARQFLVLNDASLRERFDQAAREASEAVAQLGSSRLAAAQVAAWRKELAAIEAEFAESTLPVADRDLALSSAFRDLGDLNAQIAEQVQQGAEAQRQALVTQLEEGRRKLAQQVAGAIVLAALMAAGFSLWLGRPLKRLESAIVGLGENRMDDVIDIPGPADMRALARRLDWLRLRLTELDADKARFLRHVSHELKTPLAALREGVALLEEGVAGELNPRQRDIARILRQNAAALQGQIEELLRFNAAAFEARRLARRRIDLAQLIRERVAEQRLQWQARRLQIDVSDGPLWVEVDPDKLGVALGNLLSNAIRFSPMESRIQFILSETSTGARVDVRDGGPGVAPADRERIFEPFYRGERQPEDAVRGSGIGLSIVREVIAAHGGRIELLPDGPGAHFRIELPHARHG